MLQRQGFTLIELMIVLAIIGTMATMAIPAYQDYVIRSQIAEALQLSKPIQKAVAEIYQQQQIFPADNAQAGVPHPEFLIGNYVKNITVERGAINITLGHKIHAQLTDKMLTLRPAVVSGSPGSPISWLCGYAKPVPGMEGVGNNQTSVPSLYLAPNCRAW